MPVSLFGESARLSYEPCFYGRKWKEIVCWHCSLSPFEKKAKSLL